MNRKRLAALLSLALVIAAAACNGDGHNANHSNANTAANRAPASNANTGDRTGIDWNATEDTVRNKASEYRAEAGRLQDKVADNAGDLWIWTKVRAALARVDDLEDSNINVDVENGVVTLRGTVENAQQKSRAAAAAKVEGAKSVNDTALTVQPAK
jgi:hypothetical protein